MSIKKLGSTKLTDDVLVSSVNLASSEVTGILGVANGGTGQSVFTNGQLLIGNTTGNTLTKATLTAGSGISITNGAGSISIAATAVSSQWVTSGSDIYYNTGNVGIGTASPERPLHVLSTQWDDTVGGGVIFANSNTVGAGMTLRPTASAVTNGTSGWALYAGGPSSAIGDGNLGFWAHGTNQARMLITRGGNVAIGSTSASTRLDVTGIISARGSDTATDNARFYNTDGNYTYIRTTSAGNSNNVWIDPTLGASTWIGWDNPGSVRTAGVYNSIYFGTGRGTTNESIRVFRGDMQGVDSSAVVAWRLATGVGGLGSYTYFGTRVGIGTTAPDGLLDLGSGAGVRRFFAYNAATGNANGIGLDMSGNAYEMSLFFAYGTTDQGRLTIGSHDGTTYRTKMSVLGSGNVGIGTTSPVARLDIRPASDGDAAINIGTGGTISGIINAPANMYLNANTGNAQSGQGVIGFGFQRTGFTGGSEVMRIVESGARVGIGTTSPTGKLSINVDGGAIWTQYLQTPSTTSKRNSIGFFDNTGANIAAILTDATPNGTADWCVAVPNGSPRLYINASGNVGINTITPKAYGGYTVVTIGNTSSIGLLSFRSSYNSGDGAEIWQNTSGNLNVNLSSTNTVATFTPAGILGLGTTAVGSWAKLQVAGNIALTGTILSFSNDLVGGSTPAYLLYNYSTGQLTMDSYGPSANGFIQFQVASANAMRIVNNGNIGIGTTAPLAKLDVRGSLAHVGWHNIWNSGYTAAVSGGDARAAITFGATDRADAFFLGATSSDTRVNTTLGLYSWITGWIQSWTPSGDVGIGTTTPSAKLDVFGVGRIIQTTDPLAAGKVAAKILSYSPSPFGLVFRGYETGVHSIQVQRESNDSETFGLALNPNGANVGINTLTPNMQLTFAQRAADAIQIRRVTTSEGNPSVGTGISWTWSNPTTDNQTWAAIRVIMPGSGNTNMTFSTTPVGGGGAGLTERMRITDTGRVGINTSSPSMLLSLGSTTGRKFHVYDDGGGANDIGGGMGVDLGGFSAETSLFFGNYGGSGRFTVGAWTSSQSYSTKLTILASGAATFVSTVTASDFILSSDRRRKTELVRISDALAKVLAWAGYTYRPIDGERRRAGLMAQDVEVNAPEVVYTDDDGYKSMSYEQTIPYLVEAIRDLHSMVEALA